MICTAIWPSHTRYLWVGLAGQARIAPQMWVNKKVHH